MNVLAFILVGFAAGFLAGKVVEGHSYGAFGDIVVGIAGAFVGGRVFETLGIGVAEFWPALGSGLVGAIVFLFIGFLLHGVRKPLAAAAGIFLFGSPVFAASNSSFYEGDYWRDRNVTRFVPQVALTATSFVGADSEPFRAKAGIAAGIMADMGKASRLGLESGIMYREAGAVSDSSVRPTNVYLRYISVP